jgi:hypothetical protein
VKRCSLVTFAALCKWLKLRGMEAVPKGLLQIINTQLTSP